MLCVVACCCDLLPTSAHISIVSRSSKRGPTMLRSFAQHIQQCQTEWERPCASEDVHDFTLVCLGRKFSILCPNIWFMAQSSKRKTKESGSFSSDSDICSPEGKIPCNSSRKVLDEDDQEKQPNMSDKITAQLETICQTLTSVKSRLQNLENIFELVSGLEKSISNFGTELSKLSNKTKEIEKTASDVET